MFKSLDTLTYGPGLVTGIKMASSLDEFSLLPELRINFTFRLLNLLSSCGFAQSIGLRDPERTYSIISYIVRYLLDASQLRG